jgi:hypothetical protein
MTSPADIKPDVVLAALLDKKVSVQTSATQSHTIRAYADGKRPNKHLADEFIDVERNGGMRSIVRPLGLFRGNIALVIWCKAQTDGRAKDKIVEQVVAQVTDLVNDKFSQGFFFEFNADNVITPTTVNLTTGYSTTILNVKWYEKENY